MGTLENLVWILMIWILVNLSFYEVLRMFVNLVVEKLGLVYYLRVNKVGKAER